MKQMSIPFQILKATQGVLLIVRVERENQDPKT